MNLIQLFLESPLGRNEFLLASNGSVRPRMGQARPAHLLERGSHLIVESSLVLQFAAQRFELLLSLLKFGRILSFLCLNLHNLRRQL